MPQDHGDLRPRILIVEDDGVSLGVRLRLFATAGCAVMGAHSLEEARKLLETTSEVDLVLTDINLRASGDDKSGIALARMVRAARPDLPIVGYSARFDAGDLNDHELSLFDRRYLKGISNATEVMSSVNEIINIAVAHRVQGLGLLFPLEATASDFETLLNANPREEAIQQFLTRYPLILAADAVSVTP
jgi:CheY-like chemotaxis protein